MGDPSTPLDLDDLIAAIDWVSANADFDNAAYVSRHNGRIFWTGDAVDQADDVPEDIEDGSLYLAVPSKQELGLGKRLALRFVHEHLPEDVREVHGIFNRRGAYGRFKELLQRRGRLEDWYNFEATETETVAAQWASENGFEIYRSVRPAPDA